jgi:integrase
MAGNIQKRPNGKWRARYRDAAGKEHARHFLRKQDAQNWLDGITTSVQTGNYVDPARGRLTVGTLADQWIAGKVNLKPTTRARYESALEVHVRPRWDNVPVAKVEHGDVQGWVAELAASGQSGASVRKAHGVLSGILNLAVKDKRIPSNPSLGVDLVPLKEGKRRYLTAEQVERLADAAGKLPAGRPRRTTDDAYPQYRLVVFVLAYCGLRWSELAALKVRNLDLLRRRLTIEQAVTEVNGGKLAWGTTKNHERRSVPVPKFLVADLSAHLADKSPDDLLFTAPDGGVLRNRNARRDWFNAAATSAGIPGLTPHELRHTAASLAISAGANVKAVQRMLGHASAALTLDRYADLFEDDLDDVADKLDARRASARQNHADSLRTDGNVIKLNTGTSEP